MTFISYAQNFEDVMLHRALRDVTDGFYVDVGANSPDVDSVTRAFYERGWRGINIEPMAACHAQLVAARPRDTNLPVAAADRSGTIRFFDIPGTGLSTTDAGVADQHRRAGLEVVERDVPMDTLDNILARHGGQTVHFLKIDVEGAEAAVLRGLSLEAVRPWIVVVESASALGPEELVAATRGVKPKQGHGAWEALLTGRGYRFVYFDGLNRFYVAQEKAELAAAFEAPPNIFDDWIRAADRQARDPGRGRLGGFDGVN